LTLKKKEISEEMQSYSIVGDLISYLRCPLAYRKISIGNLTPSRPSQLWFGNFIHGVMEQLFYIYHVGVSIPPPLKPVCLLEKKVDQTVISIEDIDYFNFIDDVKECDKSCSERKCLYRICYEVAARLASNRIFARSKVMVNSAIFRINLLLNEIGTQLIPLIKAAEIPLKGIRRYEGQPFNYEKFKNLIGGSRKAFYEIRGIIDVISQFDIEEFLNAIKSEDSSKQPRNIILKNIGQHFYPDLFEIDDESINLMETVIINLARDFPAGFEIILDYKGQIRPEVSEESDWYKHEWQIRTYKWLREQQMQQMPVVAGILIYINEFLPSKQDIQKIARLSETKETDLVLTDEQIELLKKHAFNPQAYLKNIPMDYRHNRAIRFIDLRNKSKTKESIEKYDRTVLEIQLCSSIEKQNGNLEIWENKGNPEMCGSCDFRYVCRKEGSVTPKPEAP